MEFHNRLAFFEWRHSVFSRELAVKGDNGLIDKSWIVRFIQERTNQDMIYVKNRILSLSQPIESLLCDAS